MPGESAEEGWRLGLDADLLEMCRQQARQVLANRGWQLAPDEAGFLDEVVAEVEALLSLVPHTPIESLAEQATIKRYGYIWYAACRLDGTARQERAFEELHALLYRTALNRLDHDRSWAEDCAQAALFKIWQKLDQLDSPGSFMWWALAILRNEINKGFAAGKRRLANRLTEEKTWQDVEVSNSDLGPQEQFYDDSVAYARTFARIDGTPMDYPPSLTEDRRTQLKSAIGNCLDNERHRAVFIKTFLDGKGRQEIAAELNTTPEIVSVFKQRAVQRLRTCEEFLAVLEELL